MSLAVFTGAGYCACRGGGQTERPETQGSLLPRHRHPLTEGIFPGEVLGPLSLITRHSGKDHIRATEPTPSSACRHPWAVAAEVQSVADRVTALTGAMGLHRCVRGGRWLPLRAADVWLPARDPRSAFQGCRVYLHGDPGFLRQFGALLTLAGKPSNLLQDPRAFIIMCITLAVSRRRCPWLL